MLTVPTHELLFLTQVIQFLKYSVATGCMHIFQMLPYGELFYS